MSTSSVGREEKKPLIDAYMFERRVLFGCTCLVAVGLLFWIVAIATDHWYIISGGEGIYMPKVNRYFMSSHSGLWRTCRYFSVPVPRENYAVAVNYTVLGYAGLQTLKAAKEEMARKPFIREFLNSNTTSETTPPSFDEDDRRIMFAFWITEQTDNFRVLKDDFNRMIMPNIDVKSNGKVIPIKSTNLKMVRENFGDLIKNVSYNGIYVYCVVPQPLEEALFEDWEDVDKLPRLLTAYARDLGLSPTILRNGEEILQLVPPKPPRKGAIANGIEYTPGQRCWYIDMFPTENTMATDPSTDDQVLDYIRTSASFACITVIIMAMGSTFSLYTFMNPRYMFKRLAAGIHFISASTSMVVIQVTIAAVHYRKEHLSFSFPDGAEKSYGYGFIIAWIVFTCNLISGVMFIWYSGKKKGNKAPTEELAMADEVINIGR